MSIVVWQAEEYFRWNLWPLCFALKEVILIGTVEYGVTTWTGSEVNTEMKHRIQ
jgi:hypothetical protein